MVETSKHNVLENVVRNDSNVVRNVARNYTENSKSIAAFLDVNERTIQRDLAVLQTKGIICHFGPTKGGCWEIKIFNK